MNTRMGGPITNLLALGAALAVCMPLATAQSLRDPTRPAFFSGRTGESGSRRNAEWVLQSVLLSPERRYAIINGEVLALGGSVGGAELVAIREGEVTLRTGGGLRTVRLFPDVDMNSGPMQKKPDAARP
jgi:MSHA biogenesis protein MshK